MASFTPPFVALPKEALEVLELATPPREEWPTYVLTAERWTPENTDRRWPGEDDENWLQRCYLAAVHWAAEDAAAVAAPADAPAPPRKGRTEEERRQANAAAQKRWRQRQRAPNQDAEQLYQLYAASLQELTILQQQVNELRARVANYRAQWAAARKAQG